MIKSLLRFVIYICTLITMNTNVFSQKISLTLSEALQKGLSQNFDIRISKLDRQIAHNNNSWGSAGLYPTLSLMLSQNNGFMDEQDRIDPNTRSEKLTQTLSPGIQLNWTLFDGFAVHISKKKLAYLQQMSEGFETVVVENAIQGIVLAYFRALLEQEKVSVLEEVTVLSKDRYNYWQTLKDLGGARTYDVLQAKIAYLDDQTNLIRQKSNMESAMRYLNLVMGELGDAVYVLIDEFKAEKRVFGLNALLDKMRINNRNLQNQYINQEILKKETLLKKSNIYPRLSLSSGMSKTDVKLTERNFDPIRYDSYNYYINFSMSFNLFNGGNTRRAIRNARIEEKIASIETREMELTLDNALRTVYNLYEVRKKLLDVTEERLTSAKLNLQISEEKYKTGSINSFNYRDVQLQYLNAALSRLESVYDMTEAYSELMRLTGGIISVYGS